MPSKVLVTGNFNILHPGHLRLLRFAKECGDQLIVAVWSDRMAGDSALLAEEIRLEGISTNGYVDRAFIWDDSISELIRYIKPNFIVKGKEHELRYNEELEPLNEIGGRLIFSSGDSTFSSVDLLRKEILAFDPSTIHLPSEYMKRHLIGEHDLCSTLAAFQGLQVLVVGDLIVDEYITCEALGMSQEDPTLVVTPIDKIQFVGGAGIVAAHAAGLGASVNYIGVCGNDANADYAFEKLTEYGVRPFLFKDENRPTTLKQRFRASNKTLLRVSHLQQNSISIEMQDSIYCCIENLIEKCNLLVFSDFNYGCLPRDLINRIKNLCISRKIIMAADCQSSSQIGDISKYTNVSLITPTEREARLATKSGDSLIVMADLLAKKTNCENLILTMASEGALIYSPGHEQWHTDQLPALNNSPKDTVGAGDSLLMTTAMSLAVGVEIWIAALMGSISAAIQVGRIGNIPITSEDFLKEI
ncbi:PfkB family carbohydrate kinase [Polynucleobacter sp. MWH-UH23A]|uniref:PfkB family carbohydrate kinase n=1 Tax=Polynucleobacter sp. MWH-UH23A TaxID=1855613 RepID=UPI0033651395